MHYIVKESGVFIEINEKVHIEEYNHEWIRQYEHEKEYNYRRCK